MVFIIGSGAALLAALIALSIPYKFVRQSAGSGVIETNTLGAKV
jgi:hypothetical protein